MSTVHRKYIGSYTWGPPDKAALLDIVLARPRSVRNVTAHLNDQGFRNREKIDAWTVWPSLSPGWSLAAKANPAFTSCADIWSAHLCHMVELTFHAWRLRPSRKSSGNKNPIQLPAYRWRNDTKPNHGYYTGEVYFKTFYVARYEPRHT